MVLERTVVEIKAFDSSWAIDLPGKDKTLYTDNAMFEFASN